MALAQKYVALEIIDIALSKSVYHKRQGNKKNNKMDEKGERSCNINKHLSKNSLVPFDCVY